MRRFFLVLTACGAGVVMVCLLMLNVHAMLRAQEIPIEEFRQQTTAEEITLSGRKEITFPYNVPGTNLVVERLAVYDGPYLEDGSNAEVFNRIGIVVRNVGMKGIVRARIVMEQEDRLLEFEVETLPPGKSVLVIERNKSEYIHNLCINCYGEEVRSDAVWWAENAPRIEPVGLSRLLVTNTGKDSLENVWLYYKTYQNDPGIYIGGITYKVGIRKLDPGQSLEISPPYFVNGYSRIARITIG